VTPGLGGRCRFAGLVEVQLGRGRPVRCLDVLGNRRCADGDAGATPAFAGEVSSGCSRGCKSSAPFARCKRLICAGDWRGACEGGSLCDISAAGESRSSDNKISQQKIERRVTWNV
jgi:hypothetical protein